MKYSLLLLVLLISCRTVSSYEPPKYKIVDENENVKYIAKQYLKASYALTKYTKPNFSILNIDKSVVYTAVYPEKRYEKYGDFRMTVIFAPFIDEGSAYKVFCRKSSNSDWTGGGGLSYTIWTIEELTDIVFSNLAHCFADEWVP